DFCCFQAVQIDSLAAPVRKLKQRGIPVISMDTLLISMDKMRETGVWCEVTPNHVDMAEKSVGYLMEKIGGKGKVIHIGRRSAARDDREPGLLHSSHVAVHRPVHRAQRREFGRRANRGHHAGATRVERSCERSGRDVLSGRSGALHRVTITSTTAFCHPAI